MYLHLGNNRVIRSADVIGLFDLDNTTVSAVSRRFLSDSDKSKKVISIRDEIPKSFVLTKNKIYMTQISVQALHNRINGAVSHDTVPQ